MEKITDQYGSFHIYKRNNSSPVISIIMSAFNAEDSIEKSINSILSQTYKNFELIVSDDGSNDNTFNICQKLARKDNRIILINQKNIGLTKSLNRMLGIAKGIYIARQDADDISLSNRLEIQLDFLMNKTEYDFCVSQYFINGNVKPMNLLVENFHPTLLRWGNFICHGTFFGKKELFNKIKYNSDIKYSQDYDFLLRIKDKCKLAYINKPLYEYSTAESRISSIKKDSQSKFAKDINKKNFKFGSISKSKFIKTIRVIHALIIKYTNRK
ncbi:glycosyltransferase [Xenorhabdus sp. Vera]|uniref:glycosyltransferase family 2 protein n=1 Tax=Xenorhabdus koppenhoeferi TaxID=351659 RepID=UPI0019BBCCAC|nr:glycosyltransferase [Xenorhabdus sp. Vera]MBD2809882.1 glycosyltransferase [Xenorhabdus sp. Vera]